VGKNPSVAAIVADLSVVTVGEIQAGIEVTRTQDPVKAEELESWADQVADSYNVIAMDAVCFGKPPSAAGHDGSVPPLVRWLKLRRMPIADSPA
jgi:hypothetical protein